MAQGRDEVFLLLDWLTFCIVLSFPLLFSFCLLENKIVELSFHVHC